MRASARRALSTSLDLAGIALLFCLFVVVLVVVGLAAIPTAVAMRIAGAK